MTAPRVSFVVVTYSNADTIVPCLSSIVAYTRCSHEIIVVDNSPDDETLDIVREFLAQRTALTAQVIIRRDNVGFSRACNLGASQANGDYLFFLNPDTQLMNDAASLLIRCIEEQPSAFAAGPAILDSAGRITRTCRNLPNLTRIVLDASGLDNWLGAYKLTRFTHDVARRVEQIIGAAILVRRAGYEKLGGMDERFFVYFEEVDFCKRIQEAGGEIWFWPEAKVQHLAGRSCEAAPVRARMIFILRESRKKYFTKHFGALGGALLGLVNRLEGIQKAAVLATLWMMRGRRSYREKASGFWAVATGIAPRV